MAKVEDMYGGYDGGLSDTYEDDDLTPKKRGRKKKSESEKKNKEMKTREVVSDENDGLIEALINGEEIDPSLLDEAFSQYVPEIDLTCDTTGTIGKLRNSPVVVDDESNSGEQTAVGFVIKWCNRMMMKEDYSDSELEAFDVIKELLLHLGMVD